LTLPLPSSVSDPETQQDLDKIAQQFPIQAASIAKGAVTDEKLARPTIIGAVSSTGTITAGTGFAVKHPSTGVFEVVLTKELAANGVILPVATIGSAGFIVLAQATPAKKTFEVNTRASATELKDGAFNFEIKEGS
jgi:hypothetical protein